MRRSTSPPSLSRTTTFRLLRHMGGQTGESGLTQPGGGGTGGCCSLSQEQAAAHAAPWRNPLPPLLHLTDRGKRQILAILPGPPGHLCTYPWAQQPTPFLRIFPAVYLDACAMTAYVRLSLQDGVEPWVMGNKPNVQSWGKSLVHPHESRLHGHEE